MRCPSCGHANPESSRFCGECAHSLVSQLTCSHCGRENPVGQKFCNGCARPLAGSEPAEPTAAPRPPAPMPASVAGGRYRVTRFLGEGARKRVYLARDTRLDTEVALALVKTEGLDADGLTRVRREAQAMGRLRDHPQIVSVFDIGEEDGRPFIVSQLMEGGSVEALLRESPQYRLPIDRAIRIADQICRALDHAHRHGIVHRDLKPGNVWLTQDGTARLGDFGLAVALDRSRLTQEGMLVGTVAYIAPEQAVGTEPDARSDLYSLGAMLYEMVSGRPPFLGDDAVTVISQHLNTSPVSPTWHNPEVTPALEALILGLLEKDPVRRPQGAAATAQALERIAKESRESVPGNEAVAPSRSAAPSPVVPWGRFVGRHQEMEQLKSALEGAFSGHGCLIMLVGEPGIGKTRLTEEFAVYVRLRGAQVLAGRSYEGAAEVPYHPFVECFRQYAGARPDEQLRQELGDGAPEVAKLVSEVRQRFPDLPTAPTLQGDAERLRLFESVTAFLRNAASAQPLVIVLDDLHWSDKPTLLMLRYLARNLAEERLLMVGAYRDVELDRTHPLAEVLATLRREPFYQRILLRGLPEDDVTDWLTALAQEEEDPEATARRRALAAALFQETEGNPFFIAEVLTHLVEEGKLVREEGRWRTRVTSASGLGIPEGVREVVGRRLSRLSEPCNRMLTLAAAMPAGFAWEVLRTASDEPEEVLLDALDEALGARLIQELKDDRAPRYEFTHALIRQTLYEELSAPRRVLIHRRIGERLEEFHGESIGPHLGELAHHFFQAAPGGDVDKAIAYAVQAGERAVSIAAYEEALEHYDRALQALDLKQPDEPLRRCELLLQLTEVHATLGTVDQGKQVALRAAELARSLGDTEMLARAGLYMGTGLQVAPDETRVQILNEALAGLGEGDSALSVRVLSRLALEFGMLDPARAESFAERALDTARRVGDSEALAHALHAMHVALGSVERLEERQAIAAELMQVASQSGLTAFLSIGLWERFLHLLEQGDAEGAKPALDAYVALQKEAREPQGIWLATVYRGLWALLEGRFVEAERLAEEARAHARRFEHPGGEIDYAIQIARVRVEQGRLEELLPIYEAVNQRAPHHGWRSRIAQLCAELGREEQARREFEQLAVEDFGTIQHDFAWLLTVCYAAEVCAFLGDQRRAEILYRMLLPHAQRNIVVVSAACNGSVSRELGLLAAALGRLEDAERHFEDALALNRRMGSPPLTARAQCDYARMLLARDAPGDRERALQLTAEALATARKLGMKLVAERALAAKLQAQGVDSSESGQSIYAVASRLHDQPPDLQPHAASDGTVTLMFSDMEGFTSMTERLGDIRAREVIRDHNRIVRQQTSAHRGHEVELQGDGFLLAFGSARSALHCAIDVQRDFARYNGAHPDEPIRVRIGLHTGEVLRDSDKFFGRTVILAARIAAQASGGEILASNLVRELSQSLGDLSFGTPREKELKGIAEPQRLHPVLWD